ncbi:MAG: hypothetical protein CMH57_01500 [Myxococcales bacterium]|nr:hypothetical protein [Myxococcales bacterium]
MSKPSPLQRVKSEYGSKENLVDQLVSKLERFDDEGADEFKVRLMRVSNKKLLRLMSVQQRFESEFGDKGTLVERIISYKNPKQANDQPFKEKLLSYRVTRLLDLHDSLKRKA